MPLAERRGRRRRDWSSRIFLPSGDDELDSLTDRLALKEAIRSLPPRQREIIVLRYFRDMSQQQTADLLGLTQVKISREEKKIFEQLRQSL
ncbi:MAG: sigma-70 family RNA polymerase sigma factor [Eubacteriales bacterium]